MGIHYLTFMGKNLENGKELTLVRISDNVGMNSKDIVNSVGVSNDIVAMNYIPMNNI